MILGAILVVVVVVVVWMDGGWDVCVDSTEP